MDALGRNPNRWRAGQGPNAHDGDVDGDFDGHVFLF